MSPDFISRNSNYTLDFKKTEVFLLRACHCKKIRVLDKLTHETEHDHFPYYPSPTTCSLHWDDGQFDLFRTLDWRVLPSMILKAQKWSMSAKVCLANKLLFKLILWNPTNQNICMASLPFPKTWNERLSGIGIGFDPSSCLLLSW